MKYLTCNNPVEEEQNKNQIEIENVREDRKMSPEFEKLMKDLREEGREEGVLNTLATLVKKGLLNIKDAAMQANMTEKEFIELMPA